ncbi:hypothetical protein BWQ95_22685 [Aeromonas hydrophila]|uniref:Uncharacterized protein n=1 Tax=Aeromonas hydrophila TaxID=644 RepID=A0AAQ3HAZ3_AERHY|nr:MULTISPECIES: hypothetical protein [Aeromonas]GKQ64662.1 hypothetical protein KAM338_48390 [Aeromonas caviae]MCV9381649.1 hypothetical protein [Aeromonas hydrophila]MDD9224096.1 hypothetical protein [Aeromonas hydrophila]ONG02123.1 hypothetical protein BWQ95_22685 [Aeromonas hydrophila]WEA32508.1 hypothetical protein PWO56_12125 [Aeromonas hydrophila]
MKKMTIIAAMLLSAGAAQAADGFDITGPQAAILAIIVALGTFLATVGVAKVSLNGGIWGWKKISSMVSSR